MTVGLENLVENYKSSRSKFLKENWFNKLSPLFRMFGAAFFTKKLLKLELQIQNKAKSDAEGIIGLNKISIEELKSYSHSLKTISQKYIERNTFIIISIILMGILFGPAKPLVMLIIPSLPDSAVYFIYFLIISVLIERHYINSQVAVYQELSLLIDRHINEET